MKGKLMLTLALLGLCLGATAREWAFGRGRLVVKEVAHNAVRIQYVEDAPETALPEWLYVKDQEVKARDVRVSVDEERGVLTIRNRRGETLFTATSHQLKKVGVAGMNTHEAQLTIDSPTDEVLYGLGQFQDGYANVRGLSRRLTQVNTQIAIPMMLSSRGFGILWNNYGLVDFNPLPHRIALEQERGVGGQEVVNVTSTEGGRQEVRERYLFGAELDVPREADYSLLLDVGQKMARRHNLAIDGETIIDMQNLWLPPTTSVIVHLKAGRHKLSAELSKGDQPLLFYGPVEDQTVFRSPVAQAVDYTVFTGTADEMIASFRELTGQAPLMPQWALGYIHCRERFHSQAELLETATRFRREGLPVDVMVQDWLYWGKYGWNAMQFDEDTYPDPRAMTDSLHRMNMRLMISVWSKVDRNSEVGKQMASEGHYIPETDWVDFFSPKAAAHYWQQMSRRLVPMGIDAWWQDATEPENDDLEGRRVGDGKYAGELFRNVYPLLVNKTVYEGLRHDQPERRPMILTRSGFPGIQRYGSAMWSGDVGNDWETFRRQLTAGLGMQAAGIPWWTYDAGGFFRPSNQYEDEAYRERLVRWIQTSVFLPLMRVHGYVSRTEPWNYGPRVRNLIEMALHERYALLPYIYSHAAAVSFEGSTLMRPLLFDFASDAQALRQKYEYMFGRSLLVSPITEPGVSSWPTYLPRNPGGWYDIHTGRHYEGGQTVETTVSDAYLPVFARGGSIVPLGPERQFAAQKADAPLELHVFPGADATFTLYEDDGHSNRYEQGEQSRIEIKWNDKSRRLTIGRREGTYEGMPQERSFVAVIHGTNERHEVQYSGKSLSLKAR